jgi:hypothetical protein
MYMEIASSGNVSLLNAPDNMEAWEEIVHLNCKANGDNEYNQYVQLAKSYALAVNEYIRTNAAISKLCIVVDRDLAEELTKKGYKISLDGNSEDYAESLIRASNKTANLLTRINMKKSEMNRLSTPGKGLQKGLEEILAALSYSIGFPVNEDIKLSRFNEYTRILRVRAEQEKQAHGRIK